MRRSLTPSPITGRASPTHYAAAGIRQLTPLPDGGVLVSFGSDQNGDLNDTQQVWKDNQWRTIVNFNAPPLYPRMHVLGDGRVFMSGPLPLTQFLDTSGAGSWTPSTDRPSQHPGLCPFRVMYDDGKILYAGGGIAPLNNADNPRSRTDRCRSGSRPIP